MRFEFLTTVLMKIQVCWDAVLYQLVNIANCFG
jgi:hypothetical protein